MSVRAISRNLWLLMVGLAVVGSGCSVKRMAVNKVGSALAGSGTTFASDDDPELVKAAVPFSLKLMESLLAASPGHRGLLLATASGFTQYAYAFVQQEADRLEDQDVERLGQGMGMVTAACTVNLSALYEELAISI